MTGYSAEIQKTPEDLRNALLGTYANFLEDKITGNDRDLTVTETGEIQQRCRELLKSAGNLDIEMPEGGPAIMASSFCFAVCSILSAPVYGTFDNRQVFFRAEFQLVG